MFVKNLQPKFFSFCDEDMSGITQYSKLFDSPALEKYSTNQRVMEYPQSKYLI